MVFGLLKTVISGKEFGISVIDRSLGQRLWLPLFYQGLRCCGCCNNKCATVNEIICRKMGKTWGNISSFAWGKSSSESFGVCVCTL